MRPLRFSLVTDKPNNMYIHNSYIHDELITDFQALVAPESFTKPTQFAEFGMNLNIYKIFKEYSNPDKACILELGPTFKQYGSALPALSGISYFVSETIDGIERSAELNSTSSWFTDSSTNKYVIIKSTSATTDVLTNIYIRYGYLLHATWMFLGTKINTLTYDSATNTVYTKYIFFENLSSLSIIASFMLDGCSTLTGTLTIPEGITALGGYPFRNCRNIDKINIPSTVTNLGYQPFVATSMPVGRVYNFYHDVAPTSYAEHFPQGSPGILHIKPTATGFNKSPWTNTAVFSQIITDL